LGIAVAVIPLLEYIARLPTKMEYASIIISALRPLKKRQESRPFDACAGLIAAGRSVDRGLAHRAKKQAFVDTVEDNCVCRSAAVFPDRDTEKLVCNI